MNWTPFGPTLRILSNYAYPHVTKRTQFVNPFLIRERSSMELHLRGISGTGLLISVGHGYRLRYGTPRDELLWGKWRPHKNNVYLLRLDTVDVPESRDDKKEFVFVAQFWQTTDLLSYVCFLTIIFRKDFCIHSLQFPSAINSGICYRNNWYFKRAFAGPKVTFIYSPQRNIDL